MRLYKTGREYKRAIKLVQKEIEVWKEAKLSDDREGWYKKPSPLCERHMKNVFCWTCPFAQTSRLDCTTGGPLDRTYTTGKKRYIIDALNRTLKRLEKELAALK